MPIDQLRLLAVQPLDPEAVIRARGRAKDALADGDRARAWDALAAGVRRFVDHVFDTRGFDPTPLGLAWRHEPFGARDRILLFETLADAALAAVTGDLLDDETRDELVGPCLSLFA
jgi:hypothetical protein